MSDSGTQAVKGNPLQYVSDALGELRSKESRRSCAYWKASRNLFVCLMAAK